MEEPKVLFTITEKHLDTGLRGYPIGHCTTSSVEPFQGLHYGGYPIADLAYKEPEEIIYLLLHRELPTSEQLKELKEVLAEESNLPPEFFDCFRTFPKTGHPMKWLLHSINMLGLKHGKGDYKKDALSIIGKIPQIVAAIFRIRSDWGDVIPSKPELGYMGNFFHMLNPPHSTEKLAQVLKVFNILHYDHGGGNLSTFVGKAIASGGEDIYGSLVGAMAGLAGPLHGMANQEALRFLKEVLENVKDPTDEKATYNYLEKIWSEGGKVYGFGHAVLRIEDSRASVLYDLGEKIISDDPIFRMGITMRKVGTEFLKKQPKVSNPYPNVDSISGALLHATGLLDEEYYTLLFGLARCVGISAQIVYERTEARGGKGTPIVRPKYVYSGPKR